MAKRQRNYAFIRAEMPNYENLRSAGWDMPLFAANDPRLAEQIARAQAANQEYGIWADPTWYGGAGPEDFARQMAGLNQRYKPSVIVPDIEFTGKGYEGSQGWQYNQALARAWQQYLPGVETAITVMPRQDDFNYEAWKGIVGDWLPQAYGADPMKHVFGPEDVIETLTKRGISRESIYPVLGPGDYGSRYDDQYALWTMDDWIASTLPGANQRVARGGQQPAGATTMQGGSLPVRPQRLSQSAPMIQRAGLQHGGNLFQTAADFKAHLKSRGRSYKTWAENHPGAAAALEGRRRGAANAQ